ncbi:unnamed protein product [Onchocerca ochengi]|uniref:MSP domain-containing protein n=1 Tax=Onchocerca ochengi TaxID=42157 RepID=A0A182EUU5_ONCOC|nr:unnamed protein product [Onchocerca ochengi]
MSMQYKLHNIVEEEGDDNNVTFRLYGTNILVKQALPNTSDNTATVIIGHKSPDGSSSNIIASVVLSKKSSKSSSKINDGDQIQASYFARSEI